MENIKRSSHGIGSLPPSNAGRNTNTLGHWIWKFRLEVGIETFRHPIKGIPSFSKAFHKSPARFSTEVCDRRAERGEDAPTLAPPLEKVFVLMSGEKEGYGEGIALASRVPSDL